MKSQDKNSEEAKKGYENPTAVKSKDELEDQVSEEIKVDCQYQPLVDIKSSIGDAEVIEVIIILFISYNK